MFGFLMVLYVCSHFSYADNQGGLWNLMAFGMLGLFWMFGGRFEKFHRKDILMNVLLGIFILWNIIGWGMKNPVPLVTLLQGAAAFLGFIFVYLATSSLRISEDRFRTNSVDCVFHVAVPVCGRDSISVITSLQWNTPLLGGYTDTGTIDPAGIVDTPGTIGQFRTVR